jgi:hypothetical protein
MRLVRTLLIMAVFILVGYRISFSQQLKLVKATYFPGFSSASGIDYHNGRIYVFGDDSPMMIVLDTAHQLLDSFRIFTGEQRRLSWDTKPDIESSFMRKQNGRLHVYALSSFSSQKRNKLADVEINENGRPISKQITDVRLGKGGLAEINIEAAASVAGKLVLGNRANNTHRINYLLVMNSMDEKSIVDSGFRTIRLRLRRSDKVVGLSGMCYLEEQDMLLITGSTEDTPNANTDGAIGESYVGFIKHISSKLRRKKIRANKMIPLSSVLKQDGPQKIESIASEGGSGKQVIIHLATDNDNGSSNLYKLVWTF